MRLSVLDTSPIVRGSTPRQALLNTVDLAQRADELGYHRYWVPEHHGMRGVASSAPAVLVGHLANSTRRIRVGSGGVLLPSHPPIVVAEQFGTLAALHPGRIDLGLGRAPGGAAAAADAVRPEADRRAVPFDQQLRELLGYLDPAKEPPQAVPVLGGNVPDVWLLGRSPESQAIARELGLPYAFARHLDTKTQVSQPDLVSVAVIAAEDDERAEWIAGSFHLKVFSRGTGNRILLPSPEDAAALDFPRTANVLVGGPDTIRRRLGQIVDDTGTQELMITSPIFHHADRVASYEILAGITI